MKKIIYKILYICLFAFTVIILNNTKVQAASVSLSATTIEPTEGQSVTVTGKVTAGAWNLQLAGNGKSETIYGYTQSNANASDSKSITFTAGSAGTTYTFTLTGDMTDITSDNSEPVSKSIKITVKAPVVTPPAPDPEPETTPTTPTTPTPEPKPETPPAPVTKSSEARLKNFGISPSQYDFSGFSKNTSKENWNATVPNDIAEVEVYASPKDSKAKVEGTGKISLKEGANTVKVKVTAEDGTTTKTYTLTITRKTAEEQAKEDGEARLKSLGIKPKQYDFTGFDSEKTEYSVEVPNEVEEIEVYATAMKSTAQITGTGMITLEEGLNELKIESIAADGTKKTYILNVTRKETEETKGTTEEVFGLSILTVQGLTLSPKFDTETYEYTIQLDEDLSLLQIGTRPTLDEATVEIVGNENLQDGENIITILVKNEKTEESATYQITVNKNIIVEEVVEQMSWLKPATWGKEEIIKIAIILVLITLIIIAIILKINISKENDKNNKVDFPGAEELDKAIAEHQELSEERDSQIEQNYIEEIAMNKFGSDEDMETKIKRRGRHF